MQLMPEWQVPTKYAMVAHHYKRADDPKDYLGKHAAISTSLEPQPPALV
jgi:hypothetical protein